MTMEAHVINNFGDAIEGMKNAENWARKGWNGKGMYIRLVNPYLDGMMRATDNYAEADGTWHPFIAMKTADNMFVPWLASQTDMLAEDWERVG